MVEFGVGHSGQPVGLGSLSVGGPALSSGADDLGYPEGKEDHVTMLFLGFHQDGLRRFSGNEYVLATRSKFSVFVLDHCNTAFQVK